MLLTTISLSNKHKYVRNLNKEYSYKIVRFLVLTQILYNQEIYTVR